MKDYSKLGISKEELEQFYKTNSIEETAKKFNTSKYYIKQILTFYGIEKHSIGEAISAGAKKSRMSRITREELEAYHLTHSVEDCAKYFNVSYPSIVKLLNDYNIPRHSHAEANKLGMLNAYGVENAMNIPSTKERIKQSMLDRYGVEHYSQTDSYKESYKSTLLKRYGVEHSSKIPGNREKAKQTILERYGADNFNNRKKAKQTMLAKYGVTSPLKLTDALQKLSNTCMKKYGVPYACMRDEARMRGNDSKPNIYFAKKLENANIEFEREYTIDSFQYDFKVGNILVEVDPTYTHNVTESPFGREPIDKLYHLNKSSVAKSHGFQCMHIFDWDNLDKIINLLTTREKIFARKCNIKEIPAAEANAFISLYHLQGVCKAEINIGLYYNDRLVSVMTFDKPRYNHNVEYELIRYCSSANVIGGAEKLFSYFTHKYKPVSVISYCDCSKFSGNVYRQLHFAEKYKTVNPSKHWYNPKTRAHITDNLLRQRGYDQLFGADYGKGASNEELMRNSGFVEIYDCGQQTYIWKSNN